MEEARERSASDARKRCSPSWSSDRRPSAALSAVHRRCTRTCSYEHSALRRVRCTRTPYCAVLYCIILYCTWMCGCWAIDPLTRKLLSLLAYCATKRSVMFSYCSEKRSSFTMYCKCQYTTAPVSSYSYWSHFFYERSRRLRMRGRIEVQRSSRRAQFAAFSDYFPRVRIR